VERLKANAAYDYGGTSSGTEQEIGRVKPTDNGKENGFEWQRSGAN